MSTVALPGMTAQHFTLALGPKGPQTNMVDMPGNATVAV